MHASGIHVIRRTVIWAQPCATWPDRGTHITCTGLKKQRGKSRYPIQQNLLINCSSNTGEILKHSGLTGAEDEIVGTARLRPVCHWHYHFAGWLWCASGRAGPTVKCVSEHYSIFLRCAGAYFAAAHLCQVIAWPGSRKPRFKESMLDALQERIMSEPYGDEPWAEGLGSLWSEGVMTYHWH